MKRVLSWLCLLIAFSAIPLTALAENWAQDLWLCYKIDGGAWTWNEKLTKAGDTFTKTLPDAKQKVEWAVLRYEVSGNTDDEKLAAIKADKAWKQYACSDNTFTSGKTYTMYLYGTRNDINTINAAGVHTMKFKCTGNKDNDSNEIVDFSFTTTSGSVEPTSFYYGYQGDDSSKDEGWVFNQKLTPDASGRYSFVIDDKNRQDQFFYITSEYNAKWPSKRYHGTDTNSDTELSRTSVNNLKSQACQKVLKISHAKNNKITVSFTVNADGSLNLKYTMEGGPVVEDPSTKTNLPLRPQDFFVGETDVKRPHYFLVGTRMADWRLQPEWELEVKDGKAVIDLPRIMYTGLISVAMVDNYDDYSHSRYTRYASPNGVTFYQNYLSSQLASKGVYEYYRSGKVTSGYDTFCAQTDANYDEGAVRYNKGMLCKRIEVSLDGSGNPSNIAFTLSNDPFKDVSKYLTFSLVGEKIIHEGMDNADNTAKGMSTWQDAWVQYNPSTGLPYRDANGRLFYQTVFQSNWLDKHPSYFNKKLADGRDFNYTSRSIIMKNVELMSDDGELEGDPYAAYYKRFDGANKQLGGDQHFLLGENISYKEFMRFHNDKAGISYDGRTANWQCFVVKDMWMDGTFKVWTGWGGGIKDNENVNLGNETVTNARWYYVNGGHAHQNCKGKCEASDHNGGGAEVRGYDIFRKLANGALPEVGLAATSQDVNEADFNIKNLTYFKRVIVWYDPEQGFSNSALQLIIERMGPAIQAVRGTLGSQIDYYWNIPDVDNNFSTEEKAQHVEEYVITRYKLNEATGKFLPDGVVEEVGDQGKTVADYLEAVRQTDSNLKGGTYQYRVDLRLRDSAGNKTTRFAMSNRVTLFDASQPVLAETFQVTEGKGDAMKYSFDLELDLDLANFAVSATYQGQGITDLAQGYIVWVPEGEQDDLNGATAKTVTCHDVTIPIDNFVSEPVEVTVNGQTDYKRDGAWVKIPFTKGHVAKKVVWENIIKSVPGAVYNFEVFLMPNDNPAEGSGLPMYKTIFADANFGSTKASTEFYIPGIGVEYKGAEVVTYDPTGAGVKLTEDTPAEAMPMGSHNGKEQLCAPVHYTAANNLRARFDFTEPAVTDKVKENFELDYGYAATNVGRDDLVKVASFKGFDAYRFRNYLDVSALAAPYGGARHDGKDYLVPAVGSVLNVMAVADVKYRRDGKTALPQEMAVKHAAVALPALVAPEFTINGRLSTNEQNATDGKRYYVHDLYANIEFTNTAAVTDMVARPGFHLVPSEAHGVKFSNESGNTAAKSANGGVVAHEGLFKGYKEEFYNYLDNYTPFNGTYDEASDNWAYFAWNASRLPVYADYFSVQEKSVTSDYTAGIPKLAGVIAYHYPFMVENAAATAAADDSAPAQLSMVTLTAVGQGSMDVDLQVATAISDIEADADWSDAEYFNLQGIRVARPQPGQVYLVRRGAEVVKVLYK